MIRRCVTHNNNNNNNLKNTSPEAENKELLNQRDYYEKIQKRMILALESLRKRIWVKDIPLVTEKPLQKTGPWILQSNEYHNYTSLAVDNSNRVANQISFWTN